MQKLESKMKNRLENLVQKCANLVRTFGIHFFLGDSQNAPNEYEPQNTVSLFENLQFQQNPFQTLRFVNDSAKISKNRPEMAREDTEG